MHNDLPCLEGPWSTLAAVDLDRGVVVWERAVGTIPWADLGEPASNWGFLAAGGPLGNDGRRGLRGGRRPTPRCAPIMARRARSYGRAGCRQPRTRRPMGFSPRGHGLHRGDPPAATSPMAKAAATTLSLTVSRPLRRDARESALASLTLRRRLPLPWNNLQPIEKTAFSANGRKRFRARRGDPCGRPSSRPHAVGSPTRATTSVAPTGPHPRLFPARPRPGPGWKTRVTRR